MDKRSNAFLSCSLECWAALAAAAAAAAALWCKQQQRSSSSSSSRKRTQFSEVETIIVVSHKDDANLWYTRGELWRMELDVGHQQLVQKTRRFGSFFPSHFVVEKAR